MEMPKDQLLALDIGTRSVVGVILKPDGDSFAVVDHEYLEHKERAMLDGQIHDIERVTRVVEEVVGKLQERNGHIEQAAMAAAGRTLITRKASAEIELDVTKEIDKAVTDQLQMIAIQFAQKEIGQESSEYYTVGHSVLNYYLDGSLILNPMGHRGNKLSIEIIATFLPHLVVDSLYTVLHRAGLDVLNLTLEPIAAMNVAIPKKLRMLNLALVDVGAGTSDIAISRDGTILSYGMVASAGDKMTEVLADKYLLDFQAAEKLKIAATEHPEGDCTYTDVLGLSYRVSSQEILGQMDAAVEELTTKIVQHILELNGKAPSAVFCIGGGAHLPSIRSKISEKLGLPEERVAVKGVEQLEQLHFSGNPLKGPEFITPMGIGVTAFEERDHDFLQVSVNDTIIRLFNTRSVRVSDALLLMGFNARSLLTERGESYFVTVDGVETEIKGDFGEPAKILVNGQVASLDRQIAHQDKIVVYPAKRGEKKTMKLGQLVKLDEVVYLEDVPFRLVDYVSVNGINRTGDYIVKSGDVVERKGIKTIRDLLQKAEIANGLISSDGLELEDATPLVKNTKYWLSDGTTSRPFGVGDDAANLEDPNVDEKSVTGEISISVNGTQIAIPTGTTFAGVFDIVGFDLNSTALSEGSKDNDGGARTIELLRNGDRASVLDVIQAGDALEIKWRRW